MVRPFEVHGMTRKRYSDEDCLKVLRQVEVELAGGVDVTTACRSAGISDAPCVEKCSMPSGLPQPNRLRSSSISGFSNTIMSVPTMPSACAHLYLKKS